MSEKGTSTRMGLTARYITMHDANSFIAEHHRHHKPVRGLIFAIAAHHQEFGIVGVAIVGRPVSRHLDNGMIAEVTRLCTNGYNNACSFLLSRCARACKAIGFQKLITYILETETGVSLRASGWTDEGIAGGGSWDRKERSRAVTAPTCPKKRFSITFTPEIKAVV